MRGKDSGGFGSGCAPAAPEGYTSDESRWARLRRSLGQLVLEALSPVRCAGCERPGALICEECLERLPLIDPATCCLRCAAPYGSLVCTECTPAEPEREEGEASWPDRSLAMAEFGGPLPRIIRAYKDAGERGLARLLAEMLLDTALHAERVAPERYGGILTGADALVFVPATASAFRRRGFDHMEAIARELSAIGGVNLVDALVKHGSSDQRDQGSYGRLEQARGAYEVVEDVSGAQVLLIDDVLTTGATLRSAGTVLRQAGAVHVDTLVLARVWN